MGRYAQRRLRGGGGAPPPPVVTPVSILDVRSEGTDWDVTFSGPVTFNGANVPDSQLQVDGFDVSAVSQPGPLTHLTIETAGVVYSSGLAWVLAAQPAWLLTPIVGPDAGVTSF